MSCPICGKTSEAKYRPFCSKRCADIDLARWLNGSYVIPGDLAEEEECAPESPPGGVSDRPH
ncbi:DNA gyrase inhibitor YacG [Sinirhodobacter huangdaonensis]|uniref:DNA gyrase inhibitor YacG n=1 Tax=Paenirhodobacter huangdaonensis TaxID=2501515 RepID=A0A443LFW9_9RHOB|nr:DNA gyrase inhibitor YacG [Sinirhodobacter huangdaonensis]RWR48008.1 DNA gyrase inhibitor YacG [Sinirhodobacter huangdaonensis]